MRPLLRAALLVTVAEVASALDDCLSKPNHRGQCAGWLHPGACWREGQDARWACLGESALSRTDEECRRLGFAGACEYKEYRETITDSLDSKNGQATVEVAFRSFSEKDNATTTVTTTTTIMPATTTTTTTEPAKQVDCLSKGLPRGKCDVFYHPGACWHKDPAKAWDCFHGERRPPPFTKTDQECKNEGYEGACTYQDYNKFPEDTDLPSCLDIAGYKTCDRLGDKRWAACFNAGSEDWACRDIDEPDKDFYRYNCKNIAEKEYQGACVFPKAATTEAPTTEAPTTTGEAPLPAGKDDCLTNPFYDKGNCDISRDLGACWSSDKKPWFCSSSTWSDQDCKMLGYSEFCEFKEYGKHPNDTGLDSCEKVSSYADQCAALGGNKWAACYIPDGKEWHCLPAGLPDASKTFFRYNCGNLKDKAYTGICVFQKENEKPTEKPAETKSNTGVITGIIVAIAAVAIGMLLALTYFRRPNGDREERRDLREVELGGGARF